jgi:hypothetical protein
MVKELRETLLSQMIRGLKIQGFFGEGDGFQYKDLGGVPSFPSKILRRPPPALRADLPPPPAFFIFWEQNFGFFTS